MRLVKISFSLPEFIVYLPLIIVGYLLTGLIIGLIQSLWVASREQISYDGEVRTFAKKFKNAPVPIYGWPITWPYVLLAQVCIKFFNMKSAKFSKACKDIPRQQGMSEEILSSIKAVKVGDTVRAVIKDGYTKKPDVIEGKVIRHYEDFNLSTLRLKGFGTIIDVNGKIFNTPIEPMQVLR